MVSPAVQIDDCNPHAPYKLVDTPLDTLQHKYSQFSIKHPSSEHSYTPSSANQIDDIQKQKEKKCYSKYSLKTSCSQDPHDKP